MIIAITGSRDGSSDPDEIAALDGFLRSNRARLIRHGGQSGIDLEVARALGILGWPAQAWMAPWSELGGAAGPVRNREMLSGVEVHAYVARFGNWANVTEPNAKADLLVAWPGGRGTRDCMAAAVKLGIECFPIAYIVDLARRG